MASLTLQPLPRKETKKGNSPRNSKSPHDLMVSYTAERHFFDNAYGATIQSRFFEKHATDPLGPEPFAVWNKEHPLPDYTQSQPSDDSGASSSVPALKDIPAVQIIAPQNNLATLLATPPAGSSNGAEETSSTDIHANALSTEKTTTMQDNSQPSNTKLPKGSGDRDCLAKVSSARKTSATPSSTPNSPRLDESASMPSMNGPQTKSRCSRPRPTKKVEDSAPPEICKTRRVMKEDESASQNTTPAGKKRGCSDSNESSPSKRTKKQHPVQHGEGSNGQESTLPQLSGMQRTHSAPSQKGLPPVVTGSCSNVPTMGLGLFQQELQRSYSEPHNNGPFPVMNRRSTTITYDQRAQQNNFMGPDNARYPARNDFTGNPSPCGSGPIPYNDNGSCSWAHINGQSFLASPTSNNPNSGMNFPSYPYNQGPLSGSPQEQTQGMSFRYSPPQRNIAGQIPRTHPPVDERQRASRLYQPRDRIPTEPMPPHARPLTAAERLADLHRDQGRRVRERVAQQELAKQQRQNMPASPIPQNPGPSSLRWWHGQ